MFEHFRKYVNMEKVEAPFVETKKYVIRAEIAFPLIKDFSQTDAPGRVYRDVYYDGKIFNYEQDIRDVINQNNPKLIKKKVHATFTLLAIGNLSIVLGVEMLAGIEPKNISRLIGNYLSRPLFHDKKWFLIANTDNHLFNVKELHEYND